MGRAEGSITVPLCLALAGLAVFLLGLLEAARYEGLDTDAEEWANLAAESLFAGYQPVLAEKYGLFFLDGGFGQGACDIGRVQDELEALAGESCWPGDKREGVNFYRMQADGAEVAGYRLATDGAGRVFIMQAALAMKQEIGLRAAEDIKNRIEDIGNQSKEGGDPKSYITGAEDALNGQLEETEKKAAESDGALPLGEGSGGPLQENPLEALKALRKQGILTLVFPKGKTLSGKAVSVDNCLLKRNCAKGTGMPLPNPGWYERILMQEFIKPLVGNAVRPKEDGALSYGTEYIICGKGSDADNLKGVANQLLLLREGVNFLYLQQDGAKQAQALSAAAAIAGFSVNPAIIAAVKEGILAAWACVESICDVKALLSGGKVPLLKDAASWKTQLSELGSALALESTDSSGGLSYDNYLDVLLYLKSAKQAAYRSMDLMEFCMRQTKGYGACRMDAMLAGLNAKAAYRANTLFSGIFGEDIIGGYQFIKNVTYQYGE